MQNPYVAAAARAVIKAGLNLPPRTTVANPIPQRVGEFFEAMAIGNPRNRAVVATAIAHRMSTEEIKDAIKRLLSERNDRIARLTELKAPEVIIRNEQRTNKPDIDILNRVLRSRGVEPEQS